MTNPKLRFNEFISEDWKETEFSKYCKTIDERTSDTEKYPLYSLTIEDGVIEKTDQYKRDFLIKKETDNYKISPANSFVYNPMNLRFGALKVNHSGKDVSVSGYYDIFFMGDLNTISFWENYLVSPKMLNYYDSISTGTLVEKKRVHYSQFIKINKPLPSLAEQQKISDFLSCIDSKIKNQEQIVKDYEDMKKGLIQKLFSQQIRFKKQDGSNYPDWQSSIFSEVFSILKNNTLSRDNLNYNNGSIKNIHYGDVLIKFGSTLDFNNTLIPYINQNSEPLKLDLLRKGDVVFADTAEDYTAGKATELTNVPDKIVSGLHTIPCRPKINFVSGYLGYFLNSPTFHNQIIPYLAGTKVYSINKSNINLTTVCYPCSEEQERIVEILSCYDLKILKEQQILEDYKTLKKGLLQQMFA